MNSIERLNLIFEYLNSPLIVENNNIFRNVNNNIKYKEDNIYFNKEKIKSEIKLNNDNINIINNNNKLKLFNKNKF